MKTPFQDQDFIKEMLAKAKNNEVPVRRSEASKQTKWTYFFVVQDPQSSRVVIGTGSEDWGDDYSWGEEIIPASIEQYT